METTRKWKPLELPTWTAVPAWLLLSGGITVLALWCQPNPLRDVLRIFLEQPVLILLNVLPVALVLAFLGFLTRNLFAGAALTELITGVLSVANRIKIEIREEPVFPRDLALLREVGSAMRNYEIRYPAAVISLVAVLFLCLVGAALTLKFRPAKRPFLRGWKTALAGAGISAAVLAVLCVTLLGSKTVYQQLKISNASRMSVIFNETGFPYEFCRMLRTYSVERPRGYSRTEAEAWDSAPGSPGSPADVHVVFVMNEAFSDLTDQPVFTAEEDPLKHLHAIEQEEHCISGRLVVPGFGGGTANTEFDVITGMQTRSLSQTATSAMRVVDRNLDSLFRVFRAEGYRTSFIHPGYSWFYNRQNVYRWLGAEQTEFVEQMESPVYKGSWISDDYTASLVEREFETAVAEGSLLCSFTTSIQNHMSYTYAKYGEDADYDPLETAVPVPEEVQMMVDVYTEGVRDADAMLGRLRDYFAARPEPVVLVFFGDHLPYLGDGGMGYQALGLDVSQVDGAVKDSYFAYETPYVIWANDPAADRLNWTEAAEKLDIGDGESLSAAFLGAAVLELTGRGEETAWFGFLNSLRRSCPVVQRETVLLADGTIAPASDLEGTELGQQLEKWKKWSYYKLRQKILGD